MGSLKPPGGFGPGRLLGAGFTPKSALPIIAALGRGPPWGFARERLLVGRSSRLLKAPDGVFFVLEEGADGPLFVFEFRPPKVYENA
jgi:hypothetical protein